ncbi:hypothetical protein PBI_PEREGRIN_126 [Rhodococcus phage Peregrin]|nr:hypothetical protein PBI_PEREGRIN_126 [Rhodococcus phage Peregrin]
MNWEDYLYEAIRKYVALTDSMKIEYIRMYNPDIAVVTSLEEYIEDHGDCPCCPETSIVLIVNYETSNGKFKAFELDTSLADLIKELI